MPQPWNSSLLPWQNQTSMPWKDVTLSWNNGELPWKQDPDASGGTASGGAGGAQGGPIFLMMLKG